jgi:CBS-domain-containing membrane protein
MDVFCPITQELDLYIQRIIQNISKSQDIPLPTIWNIFYAASCSFFAILLLSYINYAILFDKTDFVMIVGSFGAQAILIFVTPTVPLAQPWNCIVGNFIGATIGVSSFKFFKMMVDDVEAWIWIASAVAVSLAIVVMLLTKSLHPPAGATALIAVQGSQRIHDLGYYYVLFPAVIASVTQVSLGILLNNLSKEPSRAYPVVSVPYDIHQKYNLYALSGVTETVSSENKSGSQSEDGLEQLEYSQRSMEMMPTRTGSSGPEIAEEL